LINLFLTKEDIMDLKEYFNDTKGVGVLATSDAEGKVDAAIYARPHFMEDGTLAVIMRDRLTHHNLQSNPHATFLFIENGFQAGQRTAPRRCGRVIITFKC
jgi:hypothetical protein